MRVTFDPAKRDRTLDQRGLDFSDAAVVFAGSRFELLDERADYAEPRFICFVCLRGRLVVVVYTPRGDARHVFSMRKADDREKALYAPLLGL